MFQVKRDVRQLSVLSRQVRTDTFAPWIIGENAGKALGMGAPYNNQPRKNTLYFVGKKSPLKNGLLLPAFFPMNSAWITIHLWKITIEIETLGFSRLQAIPAARTGKKLIIKLPKVATSENRQPWHFCHEELLVESFRRGEKTSE